MGDGVDVAGTHGDQQRAGGGEFVDGGEEVGGVGEVAGVVVAGGEAVDEVLGAHAAACGFGVAVDVVVGDEDVVGVGEGQQSGSSVLLRYNIRLPEASGGHVLNTVDWMYLTPNGTIMNRSQFRKFGIKVAELVATMRPKEA